jgi:AhpD family alkylhydroperoxidase
MRLQVLDNGHGFGTKALFAVIQFMSRQPVLDVIKLVKYRPEFFGDPMAKVTQEAMRGPSAWSVAERELMAAFVAKTNQCDFCIQAHSAVAQRAYGDGKIVSASLSDVDNADLSQPLRATLVLLRKVARGQLVSVDDMRAVLAAGASREQIEDALAACFSFSVIARLADAFGFSVPGPESFEAGAKYLLARGYRRGSKKPHPKGQIRYSAAAESLFRPKGRDAVNE